MEVKRPRILGLEVFKILNNMNPEYMKEILHKTAFPTQRPLNLEVLILGTPFQVKLKKKLTTLSLRNLLKIGLA